MICLRGGGNIEITLKFNPANFYDLDISKNVAFRKLLPACRRDELPSLSKKQLHLLILTGLKSIGIGAQTFGLRPAI